MKVEKKIVQVFISKFLKPFYQKNKKPIVKNILRPGATIKNWKIYEKKIKKHSKMHKTNASGTPKKDLV